MGVNETVKRKRSAVFLDRDGVINENRQDYVKAWDEFVFLPGSMEALKLLSGSEYLVVVISNQSAINRGLVSTATVDEINRQMIDTVAKMGARIDGMYYCPHTPEEACQCRKPQPGLLLRAASELQIDLQHSFCVGDKLVDVAAGNAAGCRSILVLTGEGKKQDLTTLKDGVIVQDLQAAVEMIVKNQFDAARSRQKDLPAARDVREKAKP